MTQLEKLFSQLDELRRLERYLRYLTKVNEENLLEMRSHIDDSFAQIQIQKRGEDLPPPRDGTPLSSEDRPLFLFRERVRRGSSGWPTA